MKLLIIRRRSFILGTCFLTFLSTISLFGQDDFYAVGENGQFPASAVEKNQTAHEVTIKRTVKSSEEERILRIAESTYPKVSIIEKDCAVPPNANRSLQIPSAARWWCGSFDGIMIPYAITRSAVAYYLAVSDEFRQGNFERSGNLKMRSSSLRYSAGVVRHTSYTNGEKVFTNVHEVTMTLDWHQFCGSLCAMSFNMKRTVIVSGDGDVLLVLGDGRIWAAVS